ncbi:MAG: uracil-DNA glycosylase [Candidatus Aenigmarchaeota archaeon]|nr:uracil-DNA glycosylase [Candidatus Aenigmarchaeota archaeon]
MNLEKIKSEVVGCTKCGLCKTRKNAVPGKGSPKSDIVFVGEAPGGTEDERGEPFVGSAGKRLTEALEKNGLSRDSVYITNVVKCRPPGNRVPTEEERAMCMQYLEAELDAIGPKVVCVLGNTASSSVLGQADITKNRGKMVEKNGRKYFLTFHPAAVIYNQKLAAVFEGDIATLAKIVRGI